MGRTAYRRRCQPGDMAGRRAALDAMLGYFNNQAQPPADDVKTSDHEVTTGRWCHPAGEMAPAVS